MLVLRREEEAAREARYVLVDLDLAAVDDVPDFRTRNLVSCTQIFYLLPFERLWGTHNISQLAKSVAPPFDQAVT